MSNLNEVTLIGRVGHQPRIIKGDDKPSFVVCRIATNEYWKHQDQTQVHTEWHNIDIGEPMAAFVAKHVDVGDEILVRGRLRTRQWFNKDGVKSLSTAIKADSIQLLSKKADTERLSEDECIALMKQYTRKEDENEGSLHEKLVKAFSETN